MNKFNLSSEGLVSKWMDVPRFWMVISAEQSDFIYRVIHSRYYGEGYKYNNDECFHLEILQITLTHVTQINKTEK